MHIVLVDLNALVGQNESGNPWINESLITVLSNETNVILYSPWGCALSASTVVYPTHPGSTPTDAEIRSRTVSSVVQRLKENGTKVSGVVTAYDRPMGFAPGKYFADRVKYVEAEAPAHVSAYCAGIGEMRYSLRVQEAVDAEGKLNLTDGASPTSHDKAREHVENLSWLFERSELHPKGSDHIEIIGVGDSQFCHHVRAAVDGKEKISARFPCLLKESGGFVVPDWFSEVDGLCTALIRQLEIMPEWRRSLVCKELFKLCGKDGHLDRLRSACQPFGSVWNALARPYWGVFTIFPCAYGTEYSRSVDEVITPPKKKETDALLSTEVVLA